MLKPCTSLNLANAFTRVSSLSNLRLCHFMSECSMSEKPNREGWLVATAALADARASDTADSQKKGPGEPGPETKPKGGHRPH